MPKLSTMAKVSLDKNTSTNKRDVVIAGAGIVGLTAALALAQEEFSVTIVEARPKKYFQKNKNKPENYQSSQQNFYQRGQPSGQPSSQQSNQQSSQQSSQQSPAEQKQEQPDIRAIALAQSSWEALANLGLAEKLLPVSSPIWDMRIVEAHPLRGVDSRKLHLSHNHLNHNYLRNNCWRDKNQHNSQATNANAIHDATPYATPYATPLGSIVEGQTLLEMLYDAVNAHKDIRIEHAMQLQSFVPKPAAIELLLIPCQQKDEPSEKTSQKLAQKINIQAKLLLACDGRNSTLREQAGIACRQRDYKQSALVCVLSHERAHSGVAVEWFTPAGTFASLPMVGKRSGIVWCDNHSNIERLLASDEKNFVKHARVRFGAWLGEIRLASKRIAYPLSLCIAQNFVAKRLALLGDAAHTIHPLAGQGLNLGLRDVFSVVKQLKQARYIGEDFGGQQALARYQKSRRADVTNLVRATDGLARLFTNDSHCLREIRLTGMAIIDRLPFIKRALTKAIAQKSSC